MPARETSFQHFAISATYEDLEKMVFSITHGVAYRFAMPFDDLIGKARELFVDSYARYEPTKGTAISSWVYTKVRFGLLSHVEQERKHRNLESVEELDADTLKSSEPVQHFTLEFISELSADAREIVELIINARSDFALLCDWTRPRNAADEMRGHSRTRMQEELHDYLQDMGWKHAKIMRRFREIEHVLQRCQLQQLCVADRLHTTRDELWLLARCGLSPRDVRELCACTYERKRTRQANALKLTLS